MNRRRCRYMSLSPKKPRSTFSRKSFGQLDVYMQRIALERREEEYLKLREMIWQNLGAPGAGVLAPSRLERATLLAMGLGDRYLAEAKVAKAMAAATVRMKRDMEVRLEKMKKKTESDGFLEQAKLELLKDKKQSGLLELFEGLSDEDDSLPPSLAWVASQEVLLRKLLNPTDVIELNPEGFVGDNAPPSKSAMTILLAALADPEKFLERVMKHMLDKDKKAVSEAEVSGRYRDSQASLDEIEAMLNEATNERAG